MNNATATFYNRISFLYPVITPFLKGYRKELIGEVNKAAPGRLLEIGVGNGLHLPLYTTHCITGVDISETMLNTAKKYESDRIRLLLMDGEEMTFPEASFDYVVMSHVLAVTKQPDRLLAKVYKVLKPGGKLFILNHFTPDNWLKYVDKAFNPLSHIIHIRSVFYLHTIGGLDRFTLEKQCKLGFCSYFQLLIYTKQ